MPKTWPLCTGAKLNLGDKVLGEVEKSSFSLWWDGAGRHSPQPLAWEGKSGSRASRNPHLRVPPSSPVRVLQLSRVAAWEYCWGATESLLESDMLSLWDHWPSAPDLATWGLRLSQSLNWREPTMLAYLSPWWMQGISMKSMRRTSTNHRLACASSEEWWNNPMYLGDLRRQLRQNYNKAVADSNSYPIFSNRVADRVLVLRQVWSLCI